MIELSLALLVTLMVLAISALVLVVSSVRERRAPTRSPLAYAAFLASALNTALVAAVTTKGRLSPAQDNGSGAGGMSRRAFRTILTRFLVFRPGPAAVPRVGPIPATFCGHSVSTRWVLHKHASWRSVAL